MIGAFDRVQPVANTPKTTDELFVGGIPADTNIKELKSYFGQFGELLDCRMKEDKLTNKFRGFGFVKFKDPRANQYILTKRHIFKGVQLDVKKAVTKEQNEEKVKDEMKRKVFLAQISNKLTEFDIYNYFIKFEKIETLKLHRKGGYGFLTFKTRMGPLKVFETGDFHNIKGFKVAVCSYQIESRNVIEKDKLKDITHIEDKKNKNTASTLESPSGLTSRQLLDEDSLAETEQKMNSFQQASFATGKGSHLNSTMNTKKNPSQKDQHRKGEHTMYEGDSMFSDMHITNDQWKSGNEDLLAEVMHEIEEIEFQQKGQKETAQQSRLKQHIGAKNAGSNFNNSGWKKFGPMNNQYPQCAEEEGITGYEDHTAYEQEYGSMDPSSYYGIYRGPQMQVHPQAWSHQQFHHGYKPGYPPMHPQMRGYPDNFQQLPPQPYYGEYASQHPGDSPISQYQQFKGNTGKRNLEAKSKANQWLQHIDAEEAPPLLWAEDEEHLESN